MHLPTFLFLSVFFKGENCQVKHPRYGYVYNLTPLSEKDVKVSTEEYDYYFRVCGGLSTGICKSPAAPTDEVASCQIKRPNQPFKKIAGKAVVLFTDSSFIREGTVWLCRMNLWDYQDMLPEEMSSCT